MARGKKLTPEQVYKIMISMFETGNYLETSKKINIPQTTVRYIYNRNKDKEEFVKLRCKKEEEFADKATRIINKALKRLENELDNEEKDIPINNLTTAIGTLYDKRALAKGESTENSKFEVSIKVIE